MPALIEETLDTLSASTDLTHTQETLTELGRLLDGLTLSSDQVATLKEQMERVSQRIEELQVDLNAARSDLETFREEHGFFARVFGAQRAERKRLREVLENRERSLARGHGVEIDLAMLVDERAKNSEDRATGLRASEWKERLEEASQGDSVDLAKVLQALHQEAEDDDELVGRLQEALRTHASNLRQDGLRKLVKRLKRSLSTSARDVELQEALFDSGLVALRSKADGELRNADWEYRERATAADWLDEVSTRLDALADGASRADAAAEKLASGLDGEKLAAKQVEEANQQVQKLKKQLNPGTGAPHVAMMRPLLLVRGVAPARPAAATPMTANQRAALEAALTQAQATLTSREAALRQRQHLVSQHRNRTMEALSTLDEQIRGYHQYLPTWPESVSYPEPPTMPLPPVSLEHGVGLLGPAGGLTPGTLAVATEGGSEQLEPLDTLLTALLSDLGAMASSVSNELEMLRSAVDEQLSARMSELLGPAAPTSGDGD